MIKGLHTVRICKPGKPVRWYIYAYRGGPCIYRSEGGPRPSLSKPELEKLSCIPDLWGLRCKTAPMCTTQKLGVQDHL